jgi:hypothetical protein
LHSPLVTTNACQCVCTNLPGKPCVDRPRSRPNKKMER